MAFRNQSTPLLIWGSYPPKANKVSIAWAVIDVQPISPSPGTYVDQLPSGDWFSTSQPIPFLIDWFCLISCGARDKISAKVERAVSSASDKIFATELLVLKSAKPENAHPPSFDCCFIIQRLEACNCLVRLFSLSKPAKAIVESAVSQTFRLSASLQPPSRFCVCSSQLIAALIWFSSTNSGKCFLASIIANADKAVI